MIIETTLQLGKILSAANINEAFNEMLKSVLDGDHSNDQTKVIPLKNVARLNRNVNEYLHRFIGLKPPLWLSDLCAPQIIVSALFLILLKCVLHHSVLVDSTHNNQLVQVFHSKVTKLLAFLGDRFKIGKHRLTVHNF